MKKEQKKEKTKEEIEQEQIEIQKMLDGLTEPEETTEEKCEKKEDKPKTELELKDEKIKGLTEHLQRLQAEFDNYRKRTEKDNANFKKYANEELIKKILQPLDYFELSLKHTEDTQSFIKGVEMIHAQILSLLEEEGLKQIQTMNKPFNPQTSEALGTIEAGKKEKNIVVEEIQKGYTLNDKVVRFAKVKITK